jgi:hypothetical protein
MAAVTPVALDHNFPEPLLSGVARWMPEFAFHWIKDLPPGELNEHEDHDLVYELHRRAFPVMATNNHKMLDDQRVLVAIEQTRLTVVAIEGAGDDPVFATGVLLRDLRDVLRGNTPQGMYVRIKPSRVRLKRARTRLTDELGADWEGAKASFGRPFDERQEYPPGHDYRVR